MKFRNSYSQNIPTPCANTGSHSVQYRMSELDSKRQRTDPGTKEEASTGHVSPQLKHSVKKSWAKKKVAEFSVVVRKPSGEEFDVPMTEANTVGDLKEGISKKAGISVSLQTLHLLPDEEAKAGSESQEETEAEELGNAEEISGPCTVALLIGQGHRW